MHKFNIPTHEPFNNPQLLWFTFVGEFIVPIVKGEKDLLYWFCRHPEDFQFCFVAEDYKSIEEKIEAQKKLCGITTWSPPTNDAGLEFVGTRWLAKDRIATALMAETRAELVLRFLHSTCELLIDNLVKDGPHWRLERNEDKENPLGNSFESLLHLVSNISQAEFDVHVEVAYGTEWMRPAITKMQSLRCHL